MNQGVSLFEKGTEGPGARIRPDGKGCESACRTTGSGGRPSGTFRDRTRRTRRDVSAPSRVAKRSSRSIASGSTAGSTNRCIPTFHGVSARAGRKPHSRPPTQRAPQTPPDRGVCWHRGMPVRPVGPSLPAKVCCSARRIKAPRRCTDALGDRSPRVGTQYAERSDRASADAHGRLPVLRTSGIGL